MNFKNSSRWINVSFQSQVDNSHTKHSSYNFETIKVGDILNSLLDLVDKDNKNTEFEDSEKKYPIINFLIEFLA